MAQALRVQHSHLAAVVGVPRRTGSFALTALQVGAFVAAFIPVVGFGISHIMDRTGNRIKANQEKEALAKWYAPEVAKQLGIDPAKVKASDLELAASVNPAIERVVENVHKERDSANATSMMTAVGGTAASAIVPGVGGAMVKIGASMLGSTVAGGVTSWLTAPDVMKNPQRIIEKIVEERAAGNQITPIETFMLRVAQKSDLQKAVKDATGKEYYELSDGQHIALMHKFPRIAAFAEKDAVHLNRGGKAQELMFVLPEAHWQTRAKQEAARVQTQPQMG